MSDNKNESGFAPGVSGNPNGRPKKPEGASDLRALRGNLKRLSPKAMKLIEQSLDGEKEDVVTKEQLNTSRWVVNTLVTVHKAVVAEESGSKPELEEGEKLDVQETKNTLSLVMVK